MPQYKVGDRKKGHVILMIDRHDFTDSAIFIQMLLHITGLSHTSKRIFICGTDIPEGHNRKSQGCD